jgi:hypothetical protein
MNEVELASFEKQAMIELMELGMVLNLCFSIVVVLLISQELGRHGQQFVECRLCDFWLVMSSVSPWINLTSQHKKYSTNPFKGFRCTFTAKMQFKE